MSFEELRARLATTDRILIIGCSGSGKSHLSRLLGEHLDLPVLHMDCFFYRPGWIPLDESTWHNVVSEFCARDRWIMDGSFSSTFPIRFPYAEVIVDLALPRSLCLFRVLKRWAFSFGRKRSDLPEGCPEKLDLKFMQWIWNYPKRTAPRVLDAVDKHGRQALYVRFTSAAEVQRFVDVVKRLHH